MRPATVRRLLVFAVCALGVSAMYLAPSIARSPERLATRGQPDVSLGERAVVASYSPGPSEVDRPTQEPRARAPRPAKAHPRARDVSPFVATPERPRARPTPSRTRAAATARPHRDTDSTAPTAVTAVKVSRADHKRLTVNWAPAQDDTGVAAYRVWLNGFEVATTVELTATLPWFNDDSAAQVVQVRALDTAGNLSESASNVLVERPQPGATASPPATPTPEPSSSPSASADPSEPSESTEPAQPQPTPSASLPG